jgi:3-dehydroquinate synthase
MAQIIKTKDYNIYIEPGLTAKIGTYLSAFAGHKVCIISDSNVAALYEDKLAGILQESNLEPQIITVPAGESSKSLSMLQQLYEQMAQLCLSRTDLVLALGGGVIGDLAGLAAATYMRGLGLVQMPTTLLAQVDSSVGGKVAVDLPQGKNLVGTFYNPDAVFIDSDFLHTLDARQKAAGMAEIIKYACIKDRAMFEQLQKGPKAQNIDDLIARCVKIKKNYVEQDPLDKGRRAELNFGHTLAHAIEKAAAYSGILHGEAVSIGMVAAARLSEEMLLAPIGTADAITKLLIQYDLPVSLPPLNPTILSEAMLLDKKGAGVLVLLEDIGQAVIKQVDTDKLADLPQGVTL